MNATQIHHDLGISIQPTKQQEDSTESSSMISSAALASKDKAIGIGSRANVWLKYAAVLVLGFIFLRVVFKSGVITPNAHSQCPHPQYPLLTPRWFHERDWGLHEPVDPLGTASTTSQDREETIAWDYMFFNRTKALMVEFGALDGLAHSVSQWLQKVGDWRPILIEGNTIEAMQMPKNRPDALSFHTAVCSQPGIVHFVNRGPVGGIVEFMESEFMKRFHRDLLKPEGGLNMEEVEKKTTAIRCSPLKCLFRYLNITHVNFFILDLEGGEMSALQTIDFDELTVDVMAIETEPRYRPPGFRDAIISHMERNGYQVWLKQSGRNTWFVHPSYVPSVNPDAPPIKSDE